MSAATMAARDTWCFDQESAHAFAFDYVCVRTSGQRIQIRHAMNRNRFEALIRHARRTRKILMRRVGIATCVILCLWLSTIARAMPQGRAQLRNRTLDLLRYYRRRIRFISSNFNVLAFAHAFTPIFRACSMRAVKDSLTNRRTMAKCFLVINRFQGDLSSFFGFNRNLINYDRATAQ